MKAVRWESGVAIYDERPVAVRLLENGYACVELRVLAGDIDGDTVLDTLFNTERGAFPEVFAKDFHVAPSANGRVAWSRAGVDLYALGAGDLTGDLADDVLEERIVGDPFSIVLSAFDGPSGAALWSRSPVVDGIAWSGGENFGGSLAEDLTFAFQRGEKAPPDAVESWVEAWDGTDATRLWSTE